MVISKQIDRPFNRFERQDIDNLFENCSIAPMVNQLLAHISDEDMQILKNMDTIRDYGEYSYFPVFGGKKQ